MKRTTAIFLIVVGVIVLAVVGGAGGALAFQRMQGRQSYSAAYISDQFRNAGLQVRPLTDASKYYLYEKAPVRASETQEFLDSEKAPLAKPYQQVYAAHILTFSNAQDRDFMRDYLIEYNQLFMLQVKVTAQHNALLVFVLPKNQQVPINDYTAAFLAMK